jgi:hypothetical protein
MSPEDLFLLLSVHLLGQVIRIKSTSSLNLWYLLTLPPLHEVLDPSHKYLARTASNIGDVSLFQTCPQLHFQATHLSIRLFRKDGNSKKGLARLDGPIEKLKEARGEKFKTLCTSSVTLCSGGNAPLSTFQL